MDMVYGLVLTVFFGYLIVMAIIEGPPPTPSMIEEQGLPCRKSDGKWIITIPQHCKEIGGSVFE